MHPLLFVTTLLLQAPPAQDADKAAAELLKKLEEKFLKAKSLHLEFEAKTESPGRSDSMKGELKIGGGGAFYFKIVANMGPARVEEIVLRSDGKSIRGVVPRPERGQDFSRWNPEATERCLRKAALESAILGAYLAYGTKNPPEVAIEEFTPKDVKSKGKEKVGTVEAEVIAFKLELKNAPPGGFEFQLWIDPGSLAILKRSMGADGRALVETPSRFEFDVAIPAEQFEFQNPAMLLEGRTLQLMASVQLFARYTGRLPRTLEDLARRPADLPVGVLWPEGGFWIGGAIPNDIPFSTDGAQVTVGSLKESIPALSPVGAPTERVKKSFEARIRIQLLKAAAAAFRKACDAAPKSVEELVKKPEAVKYWPEGGWAASLPVDPWGEPFVIRTGGVFSVSLAKTKGRLLKVSDLTPEEKTGLDLAAVPPLSGRDAEEVSRLIRGLGAEKLSDREEATRSILAKGGGALHVVAAALETEKDPEIAGRLAVIRDQFRSVKPTWEREMKGWRTPPLGAGGWGPIPANERLGSVALKTFTTAQADFRANDRDGNRNMDFYVRDVAGLFALKGATGKDTEATAGQEGEDHLVLKLIEPDAAKADATEDRWEYPVLKTPEPEPKLGYMFSALKYYEEAGKPVAYHDGSGRNSDRFGFVAFPAEYGASGRMTFIVNEDNTIWMKDVGDETIDTFPSNPAAAGWRKVD